MENTILIIEDEPQTRENIAEILSLANYKVIQAKNGKEGLELARTNHPDLILCDIMMPELDGYGVLRAICNNPSFKATAFVFMSAKVDRADFRHGMDLGADDFLSKPFSGEELLSIVAARIQKTQLLREINKNILAPAVNSGETGTESELISRFVRKKLRKGETLFTEGETSKFIYYVYTGMVKNYKTTDLGKEYITNIHTPGVFFGFNGFAENAVHIETAIALEDCEVGYLDKDQFLELLRLNSFLSMKFIALLATNIDEMKDSVVKQVYNSARKRVAEALLYLGRKYKQDSQTDLMFPMNRNNISSLSGISPESVSRCLSEFKDEGLISMQNGAIRIVCPQKLEQMKN